MIRGFRKALFVGALLAFPRAAEAQLGSWCHDPGSGVCFTLTDYHFLVTPVTSAGTLTGFGWSARIKGYWYGASIFQREYLSAFEFPTLWERNDGTAATLRFRISDIVGATPGPLSPDTIFVWSQVPSGFVDQSWVTAANLKSFSSYSGSSSDFYMMLRTSHTLPGYPVFDVSCRTGGGHPDSCVSVPEPSSALLLASGLLGLAFIGRRRRIDP